MGTFIRQFSDRFLVFAICAYCSAMATSLVAFAGAYDELNPAQQKALQDGKQIFITKDVSGAPWPKAFIYQRVEATPEEAAAIFSDYNLQKSYIPNLLKSQVSRWMDKRTANVDYEIDVPFLSDETYTVQDRVSSYDNGASYRVDWTFVRADSTKHIEGNMRLERLGTGTLIAYYNFVIPGSMFAGWVKEQAVQQMRDTASAIVKQIQKEKRENQPLLQKQVEALRNALR